jgi:hypothetical protein
LRGFFLSKFKTVKIYLSSVLNSLF